jgi:transcriptional regulator with XRE-family HTH domain
MSSRTDVSHSPKPTAKASTIELDKSYLSLQDVACRLKLLRETCGFSQRELAKRAGVPNSSISMIEQGQVSPSIQSLSRILSAFPINLADFFSFALTAKGDITNDTLVKMANLAGQSAPQALNDNPSKQLNSKITSIVQGGTSAFAIKSVDLSGVILTGELQLTLLSGVKELSAGQAFEIPGGQLYRFINCSTKDASLFCCSLYLFDD